jgi:GNAT superfamily N-acetyltransferase
MIIIQATIPKHREAVQDLFAEYLGWVCAEIYQEYKAVFDPDEKLAHDMAKIEMFLPPGGILLLAFVDNIAAGCACTKTIGDGIAEMKRMYVKPSFRRKGIAGKLVEESIRLVREMKYKEIRLDSAGFMTGAHAVYHAAGFKNISPYNASEIPTEYQKHWIFMNLEL